MSMLSMKTKKPILEIPESTEDAGLSSPNQPASSPTSRLSHPIHRGSAEPANALTPSVGGRRWDFRMEPIWQA